MTDAVVLVNEIKTLSERRHGDKLAIQSRMVALRDEHGWSKHRIADETAVPRATVIRWLEAWDETKAKGVQVDPRLTPIAEQSRSDRAVAQRVLREAPMEQVEQLINELPKERKQQVMAAAGSGYHQARVAHDERERNLTPLERSERVAAQEAVTRPVRDAMAPFGAFGIASYLGRATETLKELIADHSLTTEVIQEIEEANAEWQTELEVARAMAGLEEVSR